MYRAIIAAGLKKIVFAEKYKHHANNELNDFLDATGVVIEQIEVLTK